MSGRSRLARIVPTFLICFVRWILFPKVGPCGLSVSSPPLNEGTDDKTALYQVPVHASHDVFAVFDPLTRVVSNVGSSSRQIVIHDQITVECFPLILHPFDINRLPVLYLFYLFICKPYTKYYRVLGRVLLFLPFGWCLLPFFFDFVLLDNFTEVGVAELPIYLRGLKS